MAAGGVRKERQKRSTSAAVMRATSSREGAFSRQAHGRLRAQGAAALRRLAHGQLEEGIGAQGVAVVGIFVATRDRNMRKRSIAGSVCTTLAPGPATPGCSASVIGQAEPAFGPAQQDQPAVGRDQPALEIERSPSCVELARKIEREKDIFGHGGRGAFVMSGKKCPFRTDFLPNLNDLRHVRHCNIGPRRIKRAIERRAVEVLMPCGDWRRDLPERWGLGPSMDIWPARLWDGSPITGRPERKRFVVSYALDGRCAPRSQFVGGPERASARGQRPHPLDVSTPSTPDPTRRAPSPSRAGCIVGIRALP